MLNTISMIVRNTGEQMHLGAVIICVKSTNIISFVPLKKQPLFLFYQKMGIKSNRIYVTQASTSNYYNNINFVESLFKAVAANRHPRGTNR